MTAFYRWLRDKWAQLLGTRLYILNDMGVAAAPLYVTPDTLPYTTAWTLKLPRVEGRWRFDWRWIEGPIPGVEISPVDGSYVTLTISQDAAVGVRGQIECIGRVNGLEYRSQPVAVQVLSTAGYE